MRNKAKTIELLGEIYGNATTIGEKTKAKELRSKHGIKDKYQEYFIEKVNAFAAKNRGTNLEKQERINSFLKDLPKVVTSPVWRLEGMFTPSSKFNNCSLIH